MTSPPDSQWPIHGSPPTQAGHDDKTPPTAPTLRRAREIAAARNMVWIEGGSFLMGSDRHYVEERPMRLVHVDGFWIDRAPITNGEFARFIAATEYVTSAQRPPRADDVQGAPSEHLAAGSMVFIPSNEPAAVEQPQLCWSFVHGADWRHPSGPDSSILGLKDHPVVHVTLADVEAYASWSGTALPQEREWEFAAKGGHDSAEYAWGDELEPNGEPRANIWRGTFPHSRIRRDFWLTTSPVGFYPPNGYGLVDMIGNVWEWTADWWALHPPSDPGGICCTVMRRASAAADDPLQVPRRVLKGGSHLCAENYCRRYRPAARHPHAIDSSTSHVGFRCVVRPPLAGPPGEGAAS